MEKVIVRKCSAYQEEEISSAVGSLLAPLGGIEEFVKPGQKVLLKVNLLMAKPPETGVTTHPALIKAVAHQVLKAGGKVVIADSPAGPFTSRALQRVYEKCGLLPLAEEAGISLNYNTDYKKIEFADGSICNSFVINNFITEADVVINMCKLKTHSFTRYTGAVKNLFGVIPGLKKAEFHLKMPDVNFFYGMLIDLALLVKPALNIMDAVIGMEGEGPSGGDIRNFGYLMASPSPFLLDTAAIYLMGVSPLTEIPLISELEKRGMFIKPEDIDFVGDDLKPVAEVKIPAEGGSTRFMNSNMSGPLGKLISFLARPRPVFNREKCEKCGDCVRSCPPGTIKLREQGPEVNLDKCIRCFCCQEVCSYQAIEIKRPLIGKILFK